MPSPLPHWKWPDVTNLALSSPDLFGFFHNPFALVAMGLLRVTCSKNPNKGDFLQLGSVASTRYGLMAPGTLALGPGAPDRERAMAFKGCPFKGKPGHGVNFWSWRFCFFLERRTKRKTHHFGGPLERPVQLTFGLRMVKRKEL